MTFEFADVSLHILDRALLLTVEHRVELFKDGCVCLGLIEAGPDIINLPKRRPVSLWDFEREVDDLLDLGCEANDLLSFALGAGVRRALLPILLGYCDFLLGCRVGHLLRKMGERGRGRRS